MRAAEERHDAVLSRLRAEGETALVEAAAAREEVCEALRREHEAVAAGLAEQRAEVEAALAEMTDRFENRESRPEDIKIIKGLQIKVMKADQKVKQTMEEMKYFKVRHATSWCRVMPRH